jgi:murein DD-endopeptidase MepM/ murein hydrolase activator NlpD
LRKGPKSKANLRELRLSIHEMARIKYYYDTRTCKYERIRISRWGAFFYVLGFLAFSCVMATAIFEGYITYFESPQEARLKKENTLLQLHYEQIRQEIEKSNQVLAYLQDQDDSLYRMILEIEPIPRPLKKVEIGDTDHCHSLTDTHKLLAATVQQVDHLQKHLNIQSRSYDEIKKLAQANEKRLAAIPAIQPLSNKDLKRLSSPFGMRLHPIYKVPTMHNGVDFVAPIGTPIYATGNGVVKLTKRNLRGYGNYVEIEHGYGFLTKYCHMKDFIVTPGQKVARGQCIGYVGSTGTTTGAHLHYEVIKNRKSVNPAHYFINDLDAQQYDMLLELASRKIQTPS